MITVDEAAEALRLAPFTIRKYARTNRIPAVKIGRDWRFDSISSLRAALSAQGGNQLHKVAEMARRVA